MITTFETSNNPKSAPYNCDFQNESPSINIVPRNKHPSGTMILQSKQSKPAHTFLLAVFTTLLDSFP